MNIEALERLIAVRFPGVISLLDSVALQVGRFATLPTAAIERRGSFARSEAASGAADPLYWQRKNASNTQEWTRIPALPDPGADRIVFWDDSAGDYAPLAPDATDFAITTTTLALGTAPSITDFTNAQHDHGDADDGGLITSASVSDFAEAVDDRVGTLAVAGNNIDITYSDVAGTLTFDVEALTAADITDFSEAVDDRVGALVVAGTNIDVTYSDVAGTLTIDVESLSSADLSDFATAVDERARDAVGTALTAGTGITVTPNDVADTITIATTITQYTDELARDAVGSALTAGNNIDITVNDAGDTITVAVETLALADISDVTASAAEVNTLDGITATVTELNYTDGVTSAIQTQLDGKQPLDSDLTTIAGLTAATNNFMVANASAWASRTPAQAIAHLGLDADIATFALPASTTISAFGASLIDDAAASNARTTLGLGTIATLAAPVGTVVGTTDTQTLTGKTIDGDDNTLTDLPAANLKIASQAQGDILYRGASAWARLGAGTSGQFLKTQGAGADPVWAAAAVGGSPVGSIIIYGGASAPSGWLLCDGAAVSRTTYADLFAVVGTTYGAGDGSTTFNTPNLKSRFPLGLDATQTANDTLGETGGVRDVTLTGTQSGVPAHDHASGTLSAALGGGHTHDVSAHTHPGNLNRGSGSNSVAEQQVIGTLTDAAQIAGTHQHAVTGSVANNSAASAASSHTNMPPYLTLNFIIKE